MDIARVVVLVVEDDALQRMLAADVVEAAGYCAVEARNGDEAVMLLSERPDIAILFTDVRMPGETDGISLARHVSEHYPDIDIIVVSGHASPADDPLPLGSTFFAKPYSIDQVSRALHRYAALH